MGITAWYGYRAGFVATMYSLASWIIAGAAALAFQRPASGVIELVAGLPKPLAATLGFVMIIVVAEALFSAAGHLAVPPIVALVRRSRLSSVDRILGTIPAFVRSVFIVAVAILAIEALPMASSVKAAVETSRRSKPSPASWEGRRSLSRGSAKTRPSTSTFPMEPTLPRTSSPSGSSSIS
jgi:uncharacterized membrane protein required for colicin V production